MSTTSAAENERNILQFRREQLADGVQVAHVAIRRGESSLVHHHTRTGDTFYVMTGQLMVTLYVAHDQPQMAYKAICSAAPRVTPGRAGQRIHYLQLSPGDVLIIEPGVVHCTANLHDAVCRFLCIEGIGEYDFIQEETA